MGDDIVERLRRIDLGRMECFRAMEQAADEIDRLRAERDELQALIDAAAPLLVYYGDGRSVAADDVRIVDALLAVATKENDR